MKKDGFTLVELLAVIVIIGIIASIAIISVNSTLKNSKNSLFKVQQNNIVEASKAYYLKEGMNQGVTCVSVSDLISKGYIDSNEVLDPKTGKSMGGSVKITNINNKYSYEYNEGACLAGPDGPTLPGVSGDEGYADTTGAKVDMLSGLTPVVYADNNWKVADTTQKWYDYSNQEWANAVILKSGVSKNTGDTVNVSSDVTAMFVYIPRYEYKIDGQYGKGGTSASSPGEIEVNFISKTQTTPSTGYIVHPAFTFGTEELNGIWVGKFETSQATLSSSTTANNLGCSNENCANADGLTILPNVASLRRNNVSNFFYAARSMTRSGNPFGLSRANTDTHMMKNSEWGAVAYLSQSKYGKYGNTNYSGAEKQVRINNCSSYITGIGANSQNESESSSTCTTNTYETANGQAASTTGNITGVYDMSGGADEYVMGYLTTASSTWGATSSSNYAGFTSAPDAKYFDAYTSTTATTACNGGACYGQALSETSGWYGDYTGFVSSSKPWFSRGGVYHNSAVAGVFHFYYNSGVSYSNVSFRVVLSQATN